MIASKLNIIISFLIYLLFMLGIGWYFYSRTKNISDYILGGRKLNSLATSLSAQASDMSGWLLLGLPGYAYIAGLEAVWLLIGLLIGTYLNWKFIAKRLRIYTEIAGDAYTLPDYFEKRFQTKSKRLRVVSAIFILIFFLIYTISGFVAGAKLFNSVFNLSYNSSLLIGGFIIVSYTFLGGFQAVSWTDVFQGIIMFGAIVFVPIVAVALNGGITNTVLSLEEVNPNLLNIFSLKNGEAIPILTIVSLFGWGLGYFGQPHILARFMAIENSDKIKYARKIAMSWVTISLISALLLGLIGNTIILPPLTDVDSEKVFIILVEKLINPLFSGVLLAAILSAIMSTADSQLLVASSSLVEDLYKPFLRPRASSVEYLWVGRGFVILVAIIAIGVGLDPNSSVLELVAYAWAGLGATFGPIVILSLYWKKITEHGAISGILIGGITVIVWKNISGGIFDLYEIVPAFILATISIYIVSIKTSIPNEKKIATEFRKIKD
ncbi:MAG: sodium/proline symporter PutP [Ignavibacteriae bacterium]|nr:sodium/proline symporter PutP [Ignavibacteriota bacterium]